MQNASFPWYDEGYHVESYKTVRMYNMEEIHTPKIESEDGMRWSKMNIASELIFNPYIQ